MTDDANELARRAIAAAEASASQTDDLAAKLGEAADDDGRLSVEQAVAALQQPRFDPFADLRNRQAAKQKAAYKLLFGKEDK